MAVGAVLAVGLAACGSSGSAGGAGAPADPVASSTSAGLCQSVAAVLFERADGEDVGPNPEPDELVEHLRLIDRHAEGEAGDDAAALLAGAERYADDPEVEGEDLRDEIDRLIAWGADRCEPEHPVWGCVARSTFTPVGDVIDDSPSGGGGAAGTAVGSSEAAVDGIDDGTRLVLREDDDSVLYGWQDDDGLVVRTAAVDLGVDGWILGASPLCRP